MTECGRDVHCVPKWWKIDLLYDVIRRLSIKKVRERCVLPWT